MATRLLRRCIRRRGEVGVRRSDHCHRGPRHDAARPLSRPRPLPGWLTEDDLEFYAGEFERTGFRGALNRYRNVDRDWQDLQPWKGAPIRVPSLFIEGEKDGPTMWGATAIARFPETLPDLRGSHILPGCGSLGPAGATR